MVGGGGDRQGKQPDSVRPETVSASGPAKTDWAANRNEGRGEKSIRRVRDYLSIYLSVSEENCSRGHRLINVRVFQSPSALTSLTPNPSPPPRVLSHSIFQPSPTSLPPSQLQRPGCFPCSAVASLPAMLWVRVVHDWETRLAGLSSDVKHGDPADSQ